MPAPKKTPHFSLDEFERDDIPEPFVVELGGKSYALLDIQECDYREILKSIEYELSGQPQRSLEIVVAEKDREAFFANKIPNYKLTALFKQYREHYGVTDPGKLNGSSPS